MLVDVVVPLVLAELDVAVEVVLDSEAEMVVLLDCAKARAGRRMAEKRAEMGAMIAIDSDKRSDERENHQENGEEGSVKRARRWRFVAGIVGPDSAEGKIGRRRVSFVPGARLLDTR